MLAFFKEEGIHFGAELFKKRNGMGLPAVFIMLRRRTVREFTRYELLLAIRVAASVAAKVDLLQLKGLVV